MPRATRLIPPDHLILHVAKAYAQHMHAHHNVGERLLAGRPSGLAGRPFIRRGDRLSSHNCPRVASLCRARRPTAAAAGTCASSAGTSSLSALHERLTGPDVDPYTARWCSRRELLYVLWAVGDEEFAAINHEKAEGRRDRVPVRWLNNEPSRALASSSARLIRSSVPSFGRRHSEHRPP